MFTILLVALFLLVIAVAVVLATISARQPRFDEPPASLPRARPRDPYAPILRAGLETDEATTVRMLVR